MHTRSLPFAFLGTHIWLTQLVGSSIGIRIFLSTRFLISLCTSSFIAIGIFLHGRTLGEMSLLTTNFASPRSPNESHTFTFEMNLSSLIVINPILLMVWRPSKLSNSFSTTQKQTSCVSPVLGFSTGKITSPNGFTFVRFHVTNVVCVCFTWSRLTYFCWSVFTSAPPSTWNKTLHSFTSILA